MTSSFFLGGNFHFLQFLPFLIYCSEIYTAVKFTVFMFVFPLDVSFIFDHQSNSEKKMSRNISLQEAIEFCQRSSDKKVILMTTILNKNLMIVNCTKICMENQMINFQRMKIKT